MDILTRLIFMLSPGSIVDGWSTANPEETGDELDLAKELRANSIPGEKCGVQSWTGNVTANSTRSCVQRASNCLYILCLLLSTLFIRGFRTRMGHVGDVSLDCIVWLRYIAMLYFTTMGFYFRLRFHLPRVRYKSMNRPIWQDAAKLNLLPQLFPDIGN